MRFGLDLAQQRMPWDELVSRVQFAEDEPDTRFVSHGLGDRGRHRRSTGAKMPHRVRVAQQGEQAAADLAGGGVVSADQEVDDHGDDLLPTQSVAVLLGM